MSGEGRHAEQIFRHIPDLVALPRAFPDFGFQFLLELAQLAFGDLARLFGLHPFDGEAESAGKIEREIDLVAAERVRRLVIGHELAGDLAVRRHQRNERQRADAFLFDNGCNCLRQIGMLDVIDADGLRICFVGSPGRMAVNGGAIAVGQSAPGNEPHRAGFVEAEHRGAAAMQGPQDSVDRRLVDELRDSARESLLVNS